MVDNKEYGLHYLKSGILLFFAVWFFIVFLTNLVDLFNVLNVVKGWKFLSGNYDALKKVLTIYNTSPNILNILFFSDIFIQCLSAILFTLAFFCYFRRKNAWPLINTAFGISMALWAVFIIMEEIFIAYPYESTHIRLLSLELITLLSIHLLPDAIDS